HPDRWGATLFALDPAFDLSRVTRPDRPTGGAPVGDGEVLARLTRLGNGDDREASFTLDAPAELRVYAVGEIVPSEAYDYGWIEDEVGHRVWEMTRANTRWAGGSQKNRLFDGTVALGPGRYLVRYETDGSHAYGSWDQPPPNDPEAWGITVWRPRESAADRAVREAERLAREAERLAREAERRAREGLAPPPPPP